MNVFPTLFYRHLQIVNISLVNLFNLRDYLLGTIPNVSTQLLFVWKINELAHLSGLSEHLASCPLSPRMFLIPLKIIRIAGRLIFARYPTDMSRSILSPNNLRYSEPFHAQYNTEIQQTLSSYQSFEQIHKHYTV